MAGFIVRLTFGRIAIFEAVKLRSIRMLPFNPGWSDRFVTAIRTGRRP
jgi:hypothetical protein